MLEYYNKRLCISVNELEDKKVVTANYCRLLARRGSLRYARRGGRGRTALIEVESLPERYRNKVKKLYPDGDHTRLLGWLRVNYHEDQKALAFYTNWIQEGKPLSQDKIREYTINASVLEEADALYSNNVAVHSTMGSKWSWKMMGACIEGLAEEMGHTLPTSPLRFRKKLNEFKKGGYAALISGKYGNNNATKVSIKIEKLLVSIARLPNKPYNTSVWEMYNEFVTGELDVFDQETGELYNPDDFCNKKTGEPTELSETTVANILNKPANRTIIAHATDSWSSYMHREMPHMHRHGGMFALSQITMDDVDLTRKLKDSKQRVHAYYAYDVVSGCVIGASYARQKTPELVMDCFRDMFRLIERQGWGMPAGIEVENHLMSGWKDSLLKAGEVFPFVRFCAPLNSQEKYAEAMNGAKKRAVIHKNHEGIGRFYGKGKWRVESQKISDATNETYEDKHYYSWDELVADDRRDNQEWNNRLHPDQKRYPGMTRWQVLEECRNKNLVPFDKRAMSRYIGVKVETSVRRNSTVEVDHRSWWLSSPTVLEQLAANNYKVTAYYIPDEEGRAKDVYIYQGDRFIDKVELVETYNRVMAEQTEEDRRRFTEQQKKVAQFSKWVKEHDGATIGTLKKEATKPIEEPTEELIIEDAPPIEEMTMPPQEDEEAKWADYGLRGAASL